MNLQVGRFWSLHYVAETRHGCKASESKLLGWSKKYINFREENSAGFRKNHLWISATAHCQHSLCNRMCVWELVTNTCFVYLMAAAALLILVVGAVNFVNTEYGTGYGTHERNWGSHNR